MHCIIKPDSINNKTSPNAHHIRPYFHIYSIYKKMQSVKQCLKPKLITCIPNALYICGFKFQWQIAENVETVNQSSKPNNSHSTALHKTMPKNFKLKPKLRSRIISYKSPKIELRIANDKLMSNSIHKKRRNNQKIPKFANPNESKQFTAAWDAIITYGSI